MALVAGEVIHIIKCVPVDVKIRHTATCFTELPVQHVNKSQFLTPMTRIITNHGTHRDCNQILPKSPQVLQPLKEPIWRYVNPSNLATSGIYTQSDLNNLKDDIMFPAEKSAVLNSVARSITGKTLPDGSISIMNMINEETLDKIAENTAEKLWHGFITFGSFSAGVCTRYKLLTSSSRVYEKIRTQLHVSMQPNHTSSFTYYGGCNCWTSRSQEGYINVNAHIIDDQWKPHIMTICIEELEERHTAENLADCLQNVAIQFGIQDKIVAITNDSASNIVSAVNRLPNVEFDVTCAAHKIHLAIQSALKEGDVSHVLAKASKIVAHFRHSVLASKSLEMKQEQLNLPKLKLIQSVRTRWNTELQMSERLVENRSAITNVLADRNITNQKQAQNLEMLESEWKVLEILIQLLKPLEVATTILSGGILSMVQPIVRAIISNHLIPAKDKYNEEDNIIVIINELTTQLSTRFSLEWYLESTVLVPAASKASFLDPRFKQLLSETGTAKIKIRESIERETTEYSLNIGETDEAEKNRTRALDFIFMRAGGRQNTSSSQQYMLYLVEPEIDANMDPFEWWKSHEQKMPIIAQLAKKYLCIPATSVASERVFSAAGNIVTPSRNCLANENVTTNTFLHQNKTYFMSGVTSATNVVRMYMHVCIVTLSS
ncbi:E3 SUMO-protein ligase ZBED1-like [Halictus rubicundus]|uniref:E3 SUMO-protein ligase ZBED1-like n=1 Tax=Halictus rubicundus TaxID=77578 RepID=UPI0040352BC3